MTTEEKAWQLLTDAWNYFWRHCPDPQAYYEWYTSPEEVDELLAMADHILARTE